MQQKYLVTFKHDHSNMPDARIFEADAGLTWRELLQIFDPRYHYNSLKFFVVGSEVCYNEGIK